MERSLPRKGAGGGTASLTPRVGVVGSRAPKLQLVICSSHRLASGPWISESGDGAYWEDHGTAPDLPAPLPPANQESQTSFITVLPLPLDPPEEILAGSP